MDLFMRVCSLPIASLTQLCSQNKPLKEAGAMEFINNSSQLLERLLEFR